MESEKHHEADQLVIKSVGPSWNVTLSMIGVSALVACIVICATYTAVNAPCDPSIAAEIISLLKWTGGGSLACLLAKILSDSDLAILKAKTGHKP